jgi:hypothetical protein
MPPRIESLVAEVMQNSQPEFAEQIIAGDQV